MRKFIALISLVLVACGGGDYAELQQFMADAAKGAEGKISPLPEVKPYEPVPYDVGGLMDPFNPAKIGPEQTGSGGGGGAQGPDTTRVKEPLEAYPLESLKYVGVMMKNKMTHAIIQVDGSLYQVSTGNYLGQDFGVITKISESEVVLKELVQDSAGDWVEKVTSLLLQQGQEDKK